MFRVVGNESGTVYHVAKTHAGATRWMLTTWPDHPESQERKNSKPVPLPETMRIEKVANSKQPVAPPIVRQLREASLPSNLEVMP